jgi:PhnB protein
MNNSFKPKGYNSLSPYFIVEGAEKMAEFLSALFGAKVTRRYDNQDGTVMHMEVRIDDSIVMIGDANENWPANKHLMHLYLPDVDRVFERAMALGCESIEEPTQKEEDPDRRGTFRDFAGNVWSIATQIENT